jgi:hypothetical protein
VPGQEALFDPARASLVPEPTRLEARAAVLGGGMVELPAGREQSDAQPHSQRVEDLDNLKLLLIAAIIRSRRAARIGTVRPKSQDERHG